MHVERGEALPAMDDSQTRLAGRTGAMGVIEKNRGGLFPIVEEQFAYGPVHENLHTTDCRQIDGQVQAIGGQTIGGQPYPPFPSEQMQAAIPFGCQDQVEIAAEDRSVTGKSRRSA